MIMELHRFIILRQQNALFHNKYRIYSYLNLSLSNKHEDGINIYTRKHKDAIFPHGLINIPENSRF